MLKNEKEFADLCTRLNVEITADPDGTCIVVSPNKIEPDNEKEIEEYLGVEHEAITYEIGPKYRTISSISYQLITHGVAYSFSCEGTAIIVDVTGGDVTNSLIDKLSKVIKNDGFIREWRLIVKGQLVSKICFTVDEGLKKRDPDKAPITDDDILNLKIDLGTIGTVEDLIRNL